MRNKLAIFLCFLFITVSVTACTAPVKIDGNENTKETVPDYPVIVNDITISQRPEKVAVISAELADAVLAMNYEYSLVAVSDDCTQTEFDSMTKVSANDSTAIANSGATLVIGRNISATVSENLTSAEIQVIDIEAPKDRNSYEVVYAKLGSILNGANAGRNAGLKTSQDIFTTLDDLSRVVPNTQTLNTAAFLIDEKGKAVTGSSLMNTVMSYAGITNVLAGTNDVDGYTVSQLKIADPEYIFCVEGLKEVIMNNSEFSNLAAVINGKVYDLPKSYASYEGNTVVKFAVEIAGIVFPELLEEKDNSTEAPDISADPTPTPAPSTSPSPNPEDDYTYDTLQLNDDDPLVLALQKRLVDLDYLTTEYNGVFDEATETAVKAFQVKVGLEETGIADNETLTKLYDENAPKMGTTDDSNESSQDSSEA